MKITKSIIKNLTWPQGATHLRVDVAGGKHAVSDRKSAAASFDGLEGELTFGAVVKEGKAQKFVPLAGGKVNESTKPIFAAGFELPKPAAKPTPAEGGEPKASEPKAEPAAKATETKPREKTAAWKADVAVMAALHRGNQDEANRLALEWYKGNASKVEGYVKWAQDTLDKVLAAIK